MMRRNSLGLLVIAAVAAATTIVLGPVTPAHAAPQCTSSPTPPAPPEGGAVLWTYPLGSDPNTLILNPGDSYGSYRGDFSELCGFTVNTPNAILVSPGAALLAAGDDAENNFSPVVVPWGGITVPESGIIRYAPAVDPTNFSAFGVQVMPAAQMLRTYGSCRQCVLKPDDTVELPGVLNSAPGPFGGGTVPLAAYPGDASGLILNGATLTGVGSGYTFDGADLSRGTLTGGFDRTSFRGVTVDETVFGPDTSMSGATFDGMKFRKPPSFSDVSFGGEENATCTSFANTNLVDATFDDIEWRSFGCTNSLFPASTVSLQTVAEIIRGPESEGINDVHLQGAQIISSGADRGAFAGANLTGLDLSAWNVLGVPLDLTGARLDGATLTRIDGETVTGIELGRARLAGASLTNISAPSASFQGTDLRGAAPLAAANFSGANTNLQGATFVNANVSGAGFVGADLTGAQFPGARGVGTNFAGVRARNAVFAGAHLYGDGQAFNAATDLANADFSNAVLAGGLADSGGFDFTGAPLSGAHFDGAVCVNCNFTNATLTSATFIGAYIPGVQLSGAIIGGASLDRAWLYCGSLSNDWCQSDPSAPNTWQWPLTLGSGEVYGPVPFGSTVLPAAMADVATCPQGKSGSAAPAGCPQGYLLPTPADQPPLPAPCSPSALGACPTTTSTIYQSTGKPLAVAPSTPATWNTELTTVGYYTGSDDATIRLVGIGSAVVTAGTAGTRCASGTATCGDGGPATAALLGNPTGLAVGLDGSLSIADSGVLRIRKVDPAGTITTVVGTGAPCTIAPCGDGGLATDAQLAAAHAVAVDTHGTLFIADGPAGVRKVIGGGIISTLAAGSATSDVVSVAVGADGTIYAATRTPDAIVAINPETGAVTRVVGTGTSGYNSNSDQFGNLLPGTQVQVNQPSGLSVNLDGNVLFADTGNHLIRAYVPAFGTVIDDLAGSIVNGTTPQGGFNGDGRYAPQTQLNAPLAVAATDSALFVIADTGNNRVRQAGPAPPTDDDETPGPNPGPAPAPPRILLSCQPAATWTCERLPAPTRPIALSFLGPVSVTHQGVEFGSGRWLLPARGRLQFLLTESRPLVPGSYELRLKLGTRAIPVPVTITHLP